MVAAVSFLGQHHSPPFVTEEKKPSFFDTYKGIYSTFLSIDYILSYIQLSGTLSCRGALLVGRVSRAAQAMGSALCVPACLSALGQLYLDASLLIKHVFFATKEQRDQSAWEASAKKTALSGVELVYSLTDVPALLQMLRCAIFSQPFLRLVSGVYHVSSLILSGAKWPEDFVVNRTGLKEILSVVISVLSLGVLIFVVPVAWAEILTIVLLNLNALWLMLEILDLYQSPQGEAVAATPVSC